VAFFNEFLANLLRESYGVKSMPTPPAIKIAPPRMNIARPYQVANFFSFLKPSRARVILPAQNVSLS